MAASTVHVKHCDATKAALIPARPLTTRSNSKRQEENYNGTRYTVSDVQDQREINYETANKQGRAKYGRMTFLFSKNKKTKISIMNWCEVYKHNPHSNCYIIYCTSH